MSWDQLKSILEQNREDARASDDPPTICPIDGELLVEAPNGQRSCPMANYRWP